MSNLKAGLKTLYRLWMKLAHAIGRVNTAILLTLFYFIFFGFARLITLIAGKDLMDSRWKDRESYWRPRKDFKADRETLLNPYCQ